jgi:hypothetical protein
MPLSFAETHFLVGMIGGVHPDRAETFRSRLKQWQKMGFPEGTRVGKGVKAEYGATQILQLIMLVKLLRIGLTPERAQTLIFSAWDRIRAGFCEALICMANAEDHLHYFLIQLDALSDLSSPDAPNHMHTFVDVFTDTEMRLAWSDNDSELSEEDRQQKEFSTFLLRNRMAVAITIEIDSLLVWMFIALETLKISPDVFADEFAEWITEFRQSDFRELGERAHFDDDLFKQSVALRDQKFDRVGAARLALSRLTEIENGSNQEA